MFLTRSGSLTRSLVYSRKLGRRAFLHRICAFPVRLFLHKQSKKYIAERQRQLLVFSFDEVAHGINLDGVYEKDFLDTFFEWLRALKVDTSTATALDVGANVGNHSLYFSDHFRKVYSFEPNPRTYKALCVNAELAKNIQCFNFGLSDQTRTASLSVKPEDPHDSGDVSVTDEPGNGSQSIVLRALDTLDDVEGVKLIKIDVEGHEYQVISGARDLIENSRPIILFEQQKRDFKNGIPPVMALLNELGYKTFATVKKQPSIDGGRAQRFIFAPLLGLIFGTSVEITIEANITPDYYPFIIALPEWMAEEV